MLLNKKENIDPIKIDLLYLYAHISSLCHIFYTTRKLGILPSGQRQSYIWPTPVIHLANTSHTFGQHQSYIWSTPVIHSANTSHTFGLHQSYIWSTPVIHLVNISHTFGQHQSYIWPTPVILLVCVNFQKKSRGMVS